MDTAFRRYRVLSFVTGTTLLSLFLTVALHKWDAGQWSGIKPWAKVDGVVHGVIFYPIYMILSFQLVMKARLNLAYLLAMLLAGFVPGVAFLVEWWLARQLYPQGLPWRKASAVSSVSG